MPLPICPRCGNEMACLKNEVPVEVDGTVRSGDLYWCDHTPWPSYAPSHMPEYAVQGLGQAPREEAI